MDWDAFQRQEFAVYCKDPEQARKLIELTEDYYGAFSVDIYDMSKPITGNLYYGICNNGKLYCGRKLAWEDSDSSEFLSRNKFLNFDEIDFTNEKNIHDVNVEDLM